MSENDHCVVETRATSERPKGHSVLDEYVYEDMVMPGLMSAQILDRVRDFHFQGDIVVVSYPKTGTTWLQEMTWLVLHNGDTDAANMLETYKRVTFLESRNVHSEEKNMDAIERLTRPTLFRTHLPDRFFANQLERDDVKFIVIVRNPKDTLVSLYHFYRSSRLLGNFTGSWDEFFDIFKAKQIFYGDYFAWYTNWWHHRDHPNVLFVKYEDMHDNLQREINRVASFLGKVLPDDVITRIGRYGDFEAMKENPMTNYSSFPKEWINHSVSPFMRSGKVGNWKSCFSEDQSTYVDKLYHEQLVSVGLQLQFE